MKSYLSKNLRWLLKSQGLKLSNVAHELGMEQSTLRRMASTEIKSPGIDKLYPVARYFRLSVDDLCFRDLQKDDSQGFEIVAFDNAVPVLDVDEIAQWVAGEIDPPRLVQAHNVSDKAFAARIADCASKKFPALSLVVFDTEHENTGTALIKIGDHWGVRDLRESLAGLLVVDPSGNIPLSSVDFFAPAVQILLSGDA